MVVVSTTSARFFHEGLSERWAPEGNHGWLVDELIDAHHRVAGAFAAAPRVPSVFIEDALAPLRARSVALSLASARFVPHHHAAYALHIAPRGEQSGALASFMDWLAQPSTARLHLGLVGLPSDRHLTQIQVQVSRMTVGEKFPLHVDTAEPALACVYNFTEGLADLDHGGALCFSRDDGVRDIVSPPQFNSACFFLSTHAAHEVTTVTKPGALRYSATAFYVWKPA